MVYLASSPISADNDVCLANVRILKERRGFVCHHYVMVLIVKGSSKYIEEDTGIDHVIEQGDIIQRFPGRSHAQVFETDDNMQFFVKVPAMLYSLMQERGEILSDPVLKMRDVDPFKEFSACVVDCQVNDSAAYSLWRCRELISKLHDMAESVQEETNVIEKAQKYLLTNLNKRVSLSDLAADLNMSYISFRRQFKDKTGVSPGAWQIMLRMNKACELLRSHEFSIAEVSEFLGYPDIYSFSKQFKQQKGMPPSKYLKDE
jgi:AraC family transcriptional regulator of arabinose operon